MHPEQQLLVHQQKSDELSLRLTLAIKRVMIQAQQQPKQLQQRLDRLTPIKTITAHQTQVKQLTQRLTYAMQNKIQHKSELFVHLIEQLHLVSPLATIARGYSVTRNIEHKVISSVVQVAVDDEINIQVSDGLITAKVV